MKHVIFFCLLTGMLYNSPDSFWFTPTSNACQLGVEYSEHTNLLTISKGYWDVIAPVPVKPDQPQALSFRWGDRAISFDDRRVPVLYKDARVS